MSLSPVVRLQGTSLQQFIKASGHFKGVHSQPEITHVQFKLDKDETPDMLKLIGFKGLKYNLRQSNGKYHFTVSLK